LEPRKGKAGMRRRTGDEGGAANVGREDVTHDLVAPSMLQASDALDGVAKAPWESHFSFRVATSDIDGAVEIRGNLTGFRTMARDKWYTGIGATGGGYKVNQEGNGRKGRGKRLLLGNRINNITVVVNSSRPSTLFRVPSEIVVRDRIHEASVRMFLVLEHITLNLPIERSVREVRPRDEQGVRKVARGRVAPSPLVTIIHNISIRKLVMPDPEPLFPTGTVLENVARVDVNLGLDQVDGILVVGGRFIALARTVVVSGMVIWRRGGCRRDQGGARGEQERQTGKSKHREGRKRCGEGTEVLRNKTHGYDRHLYPSLPSSPFRRRVKRLDGH